MPPTVPRLYFWALQASFTDGAGQRLGAAHLGLQAHSRYPGGTAVNWGGYRANGTELTGTASGLPSALGNPNTRDLEWHPSRPYRLRIAPGAPGMWRGEVTDVASGETTVVRELAPAASLLERPVVWSEVFARCDHPSTTVRWSELEAVTADGRRLRPSAVQVGYQSFEDGGCTNTDAAPSEAGVLQVTAVERRLAPGTVVLLDTGVG